MGGNGWWCCVLFCFCFVKFLIYLRCFLDYFNMLQSKKKICVVVCILNNSSSKILVY